MACSIAKFISKRSVRPMAATSCRFFSLKLEGRQTPEIRDLFNEAICPRRCDTRNLTRLLNLMDNRIGVTPAPCPRWDVIEDTEALYIIRDMSELPNKDFVEPASSPYRHRNGFGCMYIYSCTSMICLKVGLEGPNPGAAYPGYRIEIRYTPNKIFYCWTATVMDVKNEVLKITIPKQKGKWTRTIKVKPKFYWPPKCIQDINRRLQTL